MQHVDCWEPPLNRDIKCNVDAGFLRILMLMDLGCSFEMTWTTLILTKVDWSYPCHDVQEGEILEYKCEVKSHIA